MHVSPSLLQDESNSSEQQIRSLNTKVEVLVLVIVVNVEFDVFSCNVVSVLQRLEQNEKLLRSALEETEADLSAMTDKYLKEMRKLKVGPDQL